MAVELEAIDCTVESKKTRTQTAANQEALRPLILLPRPAGPCECAGDELLYPAENSPGRVLCAECGKYFGRYDWQVQGDPVEQYHAANRKRQKRLFPWNNYAKLRAGAIEHERQRLSAAGYSDEWIDHYQQATWGKGGANAF